MDASQAASAFGVDSRIGRAAVLYPACCCRRCLLALMEFAERCLFFGTSFSLPSKFRLRLSRSNLFSHHTFDRAA